MSVNEGASVQIVTKELKELLLKRSSVKGRLTKYKNYLDKISCIDKLNPVMINELTIKLSKLETLSLEFDSLQTQIEVLNSNNIVNEINERDDIEQELINNMAISQSILDKHNNKDNEVTPNHSSQCPSHDHNNYSGIKLPQIQISKFDGSYFRWLEFHDTFSSLIHNNDHIKTIHKFHYLVSYLQGEAARIIMNIEISEINYQHAWQLLCDRYHNKRQLINFHLTSLFNIEPITRESESSLRYLVDHVTKNLRALFSLGQPADQWDTLIIFFISSKLDNNTLMKWEELRSTLSETPKLQEFNEFLINRADVLQAISKNNNYKTNNAPRNTNTHSRAISQTNKHNKAVTYTNQASTNRYDSACVICQGEHRIYDCPIFKSKAVSERASEAMRLNLCLNCLRPGHPSRFCRMGPCRECRRRHNTLLHSPIEAKASTSTAPPNDSIVTFSKQGSNQVMLCTALVQVHDSTANKFHTVRALLDCGSQSSFITASLQRKLNLPSKPININVVGIGNNSANQATANCTLTIHSKTSNYKAKLSFLVLEELTGLIPNSNINVESLSIPSHIQLVDPMFNHPAPVEMLLGADIFWELVGTDRHTLGKNLPILLSSQLGWLVAGKLTNASVAAMRSSYTVQTYHSSAPNDQPDLATIHQQMCKFWQLEEVPESQVLSSDERLCEEHFVKTTTRNAVGRFVVKLPLIDEPDCLGESYTTAKKRFLNLERRFKRQPNVKTQYVDFIQEYDKLGHLSERSQPISGPCYYLCHHAVFKENSESTKTRVVFDGSARTSSGMSINDIQMVGPIVQDSLFSILIRSRQHKYLLSGDVEKMYRQIEIHESQRDLQLILWRKEESEPLKTLQLKTVTYGMSSASYLSTRCLWQLGEECSDEQIKTIIQHDFYVDDLITGVDSEDQLLYVQGAVSEALKAGCFNLRKFRSNSTPMQNVSLNNTQDDLYLSQSTNTLGLGWDPTSDTFHFPITNIDFNLLKVSNITKRIMLSTIFKIFDPLGLLSPFIIKAKMFLQTLWQLKLDWDSPVPINIANEWFNLITNINKLLEVKIPRRVLCDSPVFIELHTFSDASQTAYGACIYLLSKTPNNDVSVRLLCSKSKVAPLKPATIPRLELCAALLAARLYKSVVDSLRYHISNCVHWCDSKVVLGWIRSNVRNLKTFVANRVSEITDLTNNQSWRYVPTGENPADLISRGVEPQTIQGLGLWWNGPTFLAKSKSNWPNDEYIQTELPETKSNFILNAIIINQDLIQFERYSKLCKLQRVFAYVKRFIHNLQNSDRRVSGTLTMKELDDSFMSLCGIAQRQSFPLEFHQLSNGKQLSAKSSILQLSPFIDSDNVIRVGGRIDASSCDYEQKHPILLEGSHHLTRLVFAHEHERHMHAGPQLLLAAVRGRVWPLSGRRPARARPLQPAMGNLPAPRVTPGHPFLSVALDFAGPFLILNRKGRGAKTMKCYLCVFVCSRYKCIHLEAVTELSKEAFLLSLRRFISRRGKPLDIFCDNGRNFVAAAKEIGTFFKSNDEAILSSCTQEGINFIFSPAYAPHFNGLAEAGVKSCKFHIRRVMGNSYLTYEEFSTLLAQVEAILNSRPLCPLSSSPDDLSFLSPGHYLIGRPLTSLPMAPSAEDEKTTCLQRYARIEQMRQHFWQRWQTEYINELQSRSKWRLNYGKLRVGDLVLIHEDNVPPLSWRLGRVQRLFPGPDGGTRVADVYTTRGLVRRSLTRLCPLSPDENFETS